MSDATPLANLASRRENMGQYRVPPTNQKTTQGLRSHGTGLMPEAFGDLHFSPLILGQHFAQC